MSATPSELRAALVQIRPAKGRVEENLGRIRQRIEEAGTSLDLIVFPETSLSGYFLEGAVEEAARPVEAVAAGLGEAGPGAPDAVIGFYERAGGSIHNSVGWFTPRDGVYRPVHLHRKTFLPTYGVFDEARFVSPGTELRAFDTRFGRAGVLVCEEMLHAIAPATLALNGAELILVLAASPARGFRPGAMIPGNLEKWDVAGRAVAMEHGVHVAIAQLVGSEGGKLFPGGSVFFLPGGEEGPRGPLFEEGSVEAAIDRTRVHRYRARAPLLSDLRARLPHLLPEIGGAGGIGVDRSPPIGSGAVRPEAPPAATDAHEVPPSGLPDPDDDAPLQLDLGLLERALVSFLRDEMRARGFQELVVGVSGGVDSAVSLFLAVRALGPGRVHGFLLPYTTSSPESLAHGRTVLETAGVVGREIEISAAVDAYVEAEEPDLSDLRRGNLAARFRALVLWDQAARLGALPLGTGNKSERLLGYFTWHADDAPPINPVGDLFKTQVWALARHLGVPEEVVGKAPSADLIRGVHDEDEIGVPYREGDRILHWLLEGYGVEDLIRAGFREASVRRVSARLEGTHWKRRLPTVATVSSSAIGEFYLRPVDY